MPLIDRLRIVTINQQSWNANSLNQIMYFRPVVRTRKENIRNINYFHIRRALVIDEQPQNCSIIKRLLQRSVTTKHCTTADDCSCSDSASSTPIGIEPPTIAVLPMKPILVSIRCIEPPRPPPHSRFAINFSQHSLEVTSLLK